MKVLVTGSEGVLGRYVKEFLTRAGFEVRGLDVRGSPDFDVDVTNVEGLLAVKHVFNPDVVVHFAALTSPRESAYKESAYYRVNAIGTANVARVFDKRLVVFASSCAVYGDAYDVVGKPLSVDTPIRPLSPYGVSKLMAEHVLKMHSLRDFGSIEYVILRFGNVYSPYDDKYVFWKMWSSDRFVLNDGDAVRDFVSVDDVARLIRLIIESWGRGDDVRGVYNVGHEPAKMRDVLAKFMEVSGRPKSVVFGELKPGEFKKMMLDWRETARKFGWTPKMRLFGVGIKWLVDGFRKRR